MPWSLPNLAKDVKPITIQYKFTLRLCYSLPAKMLLKHIGKVVRSNRAVANMKQAEEHASVIFFGFFVIFFGGGSKASQNA